MTVGKTIQRGVVGALVAVACAGAAIAGPVAARAEDTEVVPVYRLYNRWTHEHLLTTSENEYETQGSNGWNKEGIAWKAPKTSETPIYRLYNQWTNDHHYTSKPAEYEQMKRDGWTDEDVFAYSDDLQRVPVMGLFNPYNKKAGAHHFTTSMEEYANCGSQGWRQEDVAFYAAEEGELINNAPATEPGKGDEVVEFAKQFVGLPYVANVADPDKGFDCSGLVQYVYQHFGIHLPRTTWDQIEYLKGTGKWKTDIEDLKPGAVIAMDDGTHVAIYAGYDPETGLYMMVDAGNPSTGVVYRPIYSIHYGDTFMGGADLF